MSRQRRVCVESPFAGELLRNVAYADAALADCLERGEAPFAGHLLYPRVLNDARELHRSRGIAAHCAWLAVCDAVVFYVDFGISPGMQHALALARSQRLEVEMRTLGSEWMWRLACTTQRTPGFV